MKRHYLAYCITAALPTIAAAQISDVGQTQYEQLPPIIVRGNTTNGIDNTLPNVDVINLNVLRNPGVNNLQEALNYNPAVQINAGKSGTADQLRIRGFGENYTELTIDGQKLPKYFDFGPFVSGNRELVETDTLRQVDIIKGLQSPKQSSGALAGTVNLQTYSPSDFVDASHPYHFSIKPGYTSKNEGFGTTATVAGSNGGLSGLMMYTQRHMHETKNIAGSEKDNRPQQRINRRNLLVKGELNVPSGKVLTTGEYFNQKQHIAIPNQPGKTNPTTRKRLSVEGKFNDVIGLDNINGTIAYRDYKQENHAFGTGYYHRRGISAGFDAGKHLEQGSVSHNLLFGGNIDRSTFDFTLSTGQRSVRYVPHTQRLNASLYVKDQITFGNGFSIAPGIRLEHERLRTTADDAYRNNAALKAQGDYIPGGSHTVITPSLNAAFQIGQYTTLYAGYSRGSKSADDKNLGSFDHGFGFILPNPNLKEEKSNNYEVGISYVAPERAAVKLTGFYSRFHNFIDFKEDGTFGINYMGMPKKIQRPFNVNKAKTYGVELEASYTISPQLSSHAAFSWMRGRTGPEESHGVTLNQAYPAQANFSLAYHQDERWGGEINWSIAGKGQKPDGKNRFRTPGYGIVDLSGWWRPNKNFTITAGIYNLTNKKYWLSADANGKLTYSNYTKQAISMEGYTQPGRNAAINFTYTF